MAPPGLSVTRPPRCTNNPRFSVFCSRLRRERRRRWRLPRETARRSERAPRLPPPQQRRRRRHRSSLDRSHRPSLARPFVPRFQIFIRLGPCAEAALGTGTATGTVEGKGKVRAGGGVARDVQWPPCSGLWLSRAPLRSAVVARRRQVRLVASLDRPRRSFGPCKPQCLSGKNPHAQV